MKQKTRDNVIYLAVALAIVTAFTAYGVYAVKTKGEVPDIPGPILWGILSTPGIVALILERFWDYRRRPALWAILMVAASTNVSAIYVAHSLGWNPPIIWWGLVTGLCLAVVFILAEKFLVRNSGGRNNSA